MRHVSRRSLIAQSAAIGAITATWGLPASLSVAQSATPTPGLAWNGRPAFGTENQERGEGGELRIIQWQAPTMANAQHSVGTKDLLLASLVQEPLMNYLPDGSISPTLVTEVPTVENGLLADDLLTVTFTLLPDITWSDGEPFTARDVQFTWQWITNPENAAIQYGTWDTIEAIETPDERTAVVTFREASAAWFEPFVGGTTGPILPAHAFDDEPVAANNPDFLLYPIGTGPFVMTEFLPNDRALLTANERYREPTKPFFATVNIKGGGDPASAARAVLQTGDYDFAWNLQVEPAILEDLASGDAPGRLVSEQGVGIERIHLNFSDPHTVVDGQRSEANTPHPFLTDLAVRQAMALAIPRQVIVDEFFGLAARPTANILTGLEFFESPNTAWSYDPDAANTLLDEAGWTRDGSVREKDGVKLVLTYATSINAVRQKTQQVVKAALEEVGFEVRLVQIDAGTFFDSSPGNDQNIGHNYWDIAMYSNSPSSPVPVSFIAGWYAGPDNEHFAQASNDWQGRNYQRYANPEFDATFEELERAATLDEAGELLIALNDILISDVAVIPLVNRPADTYGISKRLIPDNVAIGVGFETSYWNAANWRTVPE
jgi:peptide/nickel transport system substrate-binding protein